MFEWIAANQQLIALYWAAAVAVAEVLKRVIPGTKDDNIIVKVLDIGGKLLTLGGATLLPKQEGVAKKK
jgi:hypothetical protein